MRCKDYKLNGHFVYDSTDDCDWCPLFGCDNRNEHYREFANGDDGCIHRKKTIDAWIEELKITK